MEKDACFELGYVQKTHGLKGGMVLKIDADYPEDYESLESVWLEIEGTFVPFFFAAFQLREDEAIVAFEDVNDLDAAKALVKHTLYLPLDQLPTLPEDSYYYHELVGFQAETADLGPLGPVVDVYEAGGQHLLAISHQGKEVLVPLQEDILQLVDKKAQRIVLSLPDGLLDIYLS